MKVLLVDDLKENLKILQKVLKKVKYETVTAMNGKQALEVLEKTDVDMIISDILMPEMDGYQFCRALQNHDKWRQIPFIFFTGTYKEEADESLAYKMGVDAFIRKPADAETIIKTIREVEQRCQGEKKKVRADAIGEDVLKLYNQRLITKLENKVAEVERNLQEKEVLLREVHHRVKNNLQIIISLLNLEMHKLPDDVSKEAFSEFRNRVIAMAMVHEKLYTSETYSEVPLHLYIEEMVKQLIYSFGKTSVVELKIDCAPVVLSMDIAIPCGLIINELVTNSFKHAFKTDAQNKIAITGTLEPEAQYQIKIYDNGEGMSVQEALENESSLGIQLIHILTQQISGSIQYSADNGSLYVLRFPIYRMFE